MYINRLLIAIFSALIGLLVALFLSLSLLSHTQGQIANSERQRYESYKLADELRQSSDDLTRMVRLYTVTGNPVFAEISTTSLTPLLP